MKFSKKIVDSHRNFELREIVRQSDIHTEGLTTTVMLAQHSLDQYSSWLNENQSLINIFVIKPDFSNLIKSAQSNFLSAF